MVVGGVAHQAYMLVNFPLIFRCEITCELFFQHYKHLYLLCMYKFYLILCFVSTDKTETESFSWCFDMRFCLIIWALHALIECFECLHATLGGGVASPRPNASSVVFLTDPPY